MASRYLYTVEIQSDADVQDRLSDALDEAESWIRHSIRDMRAGDFSNPVGMVRISRHPQRGIYEHEYVALVWLDVSDGRIHETRNPVEVRERSLAAGFSDLNGRDSLPLQERRRRMHAWDDAIVEWAMGL